MTKDEIIAMAEDAYLWCHSDSRMNAITAFASLVAAKEREECARISEAFGPGRPIVSRNPSHVIIGRWEGEQAASSSIAAAIRARGEQA